MTVRTQYAAPRRPAFTLLEMVIAASLTAVVMLTIVQATTLLGRLEQSTASELTQVQIASAVLERIARDLDAVVTPAEVAEVAQEDVREGDALLEDPAVVTVLVGTDDELLLLAEPPATASESLANAAVLEDQSPSGVPPRRRTIRWSLADDTVELRQVLLPGVDEILPDGLFAPEITGLTFEYLWQGEVADKWDSGELGLLPDGIMTTVRVASVGGGTSEREWSRLLPVRSGYYAVPESEEGL